MRRKTAGRGKRKKRTARRKAVRRKTARKKTARRSVARRARRVRSRPKSRKRAAKKKSAKKKSAKKKGSKKGGKKGSKKVSKLVPITITASIASDEHAEVHKNKARHAPESVRWTSTDVEYKLKFTRWPFTTSADIGQRTILVPAGGNSNRFKVDEDTTARGYAYEIDPEPSDPTRPGPEVVVEE